MKNHLKSIFIFMLICLCSATFFACSMVLGSSYTVSFIVDGQVYQTQEVETGKSAKKPEDPVKEDFIFKGWYADETFTTEYDFNDPIMADNNAYAYFAESYTVSFIVDGEAYQTKSVEKGSNAEKSEDPEKEHFTFTGWYADETFTTEYDFNAPITQATVIYADFAINEYFVSFVSNDEIIQTQEIKAFEKAEKPANPVKENAVFKGWYKDKELTEEYDFEAPIVGETSIYAYFVELYTVSFIVDGQTVFNAHIESGSCVDQPKSPVKDKFAFISWYADTEFTNEYDFTAPIEGNVFLYAYFKATHTVSFVIDGEAYEDQIIIDGENATVPETPKKDYYVFKKWCADEELLFAFDFQTPIFGDTVIYALLSEAYQISYADEEGNVEFVEYVEKDTIPIRPVAPQKEGYELKGWYLDAEGINEYNFDQPIVEDIILYPVYKKVILIYTADGLKEIANKPDGYYRLENDIQLLGEAWTPIDNFTGRFEGNGHTIEYFTIITSSATTGFVATNNGLIKNVRFEDVIINASYNGACLNAGVIAGINNGTIENCVAFNIVSTFTINKQGSSGTYNDYLGGLVGSNNGLLNNCSISCELNLNATTHCKTTTSWKTTLSTYSNLGGAVGRNNGEVQNCLANVTISAWTKVSGSTNLSMYGYGYSYMCLGGFVAQNYGLIEDCATVHSISVTDKVESYGTAQFWIGGFLRINGEEAETNRCFAKGSIADEGVTAKDAHIGGFVQNNTALIKDCYAECDIINQSAAAVIGGFCSVTTKTITSSYAKGTIIAKNANQLGGFLANACTNSTTNGCFSAVEIVYTTANNVGAFAGYSETGCWYEKCYYDENCKILQEEIEIEYTETNVNVSAITTEKLCDEEIIFKSLWWDRKVWSVDGGNFPMLIWEKTAEFPPKIPQDEEVSE